MTTMERSISLHLSFHSAWTSGAEKIRFDWLLLTSREANNYTTIVNDSCISPIYGAQHATASIATPVPYHSNRTTPSPYHHPSHERYVSMMVCRPIPTHDSVPINTSDGTTLYRRLEQAHVQQRRTREHHGSILATSTLEVVEV
jgi:hypothetical protein